MHNKIKTAAPYAMFFMVSFSACSAGIYNKDGNKLDLYGKVDARHVFSDNIAVDGENSYSRLGFKGVM